MQTTNPFLRPKWISRFDIKLLFYLSHFTNLEVANIHYNHKKEGIHHKDCIVILECNSSNPTCNRYYVINEGECALKNWFSLSVIGLPAVLIHCQADHRHWPVLLLHFSQDESHAAHFLNYRSPTFYGMLVDLLNFVFILHSLFKYVALN